MSFENSTTTMNSKVNPEDDDDTSITVSTSKPSASPPLSEVEIPNVEDKPELPLLPNAVPAINKSPISPLDIQPATLVEAEKQHEKATKMIDMVPKHAVITDTHLLQLSSAIGNNPNILKLGLKLKFTLQQSRDYNQTNYTGGEVSDKGTTKMLFDWKMKTNGYVRELLSALQEAELVAIAEQLLREDGIYTRLEEPISGGDDPFAEMFREELMQYYLDDYCCVKTDPWDEREFKLNQYFINMALCQEDTRTGKVTKIPLKDGHNDLLDLKVEERLRKRILVFGEGGMGKSTLCKKLAYDWATKNEHSPLKNIPIVCVLEFRKLQESDNIANAIHNQLLPKDSDITPERIIQFIKANPSKVVIVLDGYDEFDPQSHTGNINDLLSCKLMNHVTTIVTTRPWHACLLRQKTQMYAQVSLDGFDADGIKAYVSQYFDNEQVANKCYESILTNGIMLQLSRTPILLSMICYLKKACSEDIHHLDTLNSLFAKFLRALFVNNNDRVGATQRPLYHEMITEVVDMTNLEEMWDDLGEIALRGVLVPGKKLMFSSEDFHGKEYIGEVGLKLGILVRQKLKVTQDNVFESLKIVFSFPHLLFQEKCAGDYLAAHSEVLDTTLQGVCGVGEVISLQYALAFTCGRRAREDTNEGRIRSKKIIQCLSKMQDTSGEIESFLAETKSLDNIIPDFLDDMLSIKSYHFARSLFLLSIILNHESQAESELLDEIINLDKDRPVHSPDQDYDGRLCHSLLYFMRFAARNDCLLQPCGSLSLTNSIDKIPLFDFLSVAMNVFKSLKSVSLMKYSANFSLPDEQYKIDKGATASKSVVLQELIMSYSLEPVNLTDLLNLIVHLNFDALALEISYCQMNILSHAYQISEQVNADVYTRIEKIDLNSIETPVELSYLLETAARFCPLLVDLHLNYVALHMPHYDSWEDWHVTLLGKTSLKNLKIGYTDNLVSALDLFTLLSMYCTHLKTCHLTDLELEIPSPTDIQFVDFIERLVVEEFDLNNLHSTMNLADFMYLLSRTCSRVKFLSLNRFKLSVPNIVELARRGPCENAELEDIRIRMAKSVSMTSTSNQVARPPISMSDSSKEHGAILGSVGSEKKRDKLEELSEIKPGTNARNGSSLPWQSQGGESLGQVDGKTALFTASKGGKEALGCADERKLSSKEGTSLTLAAPCQLKPDDVSVKNKIMSEPKGACGFTPNPNWNSQSATCKKTKTASQIDGNVASAASAIPTPKTTDIGVSLIFLNKNIPTDWFSLLDLLALTANASSNLKRLRLLDVNIEVPPHSRLESHPFEVGIEQLIMAKTRFKGSLLQLLCLAAEVCPHLQLMGLSDWLEDIGPMTDADYRSSLGNLTEMRVEFLHSSVSLQGILSLTSAMCPNLRVLSIARAKQLTDATQTETVQSRKTRTSRFQLSLIQCWSPVSVPELLSLLRWDHGEAILNVALWKCQLAIPPEQSDHSWYSHGHQYQVHMTDCRARLVGMSVQETLSRTCPFLELVANGDEDDPSMRYQTRHFSNSEESPFFDDRRRLIHYAFLQHEIDMIESPRSLRDVH